MESSPCRHDYHDYGIPAFPFCRSLRGQTYRRTYRGVHRRHADHIAGRGVTADPHGCQCYFEKETERR